MSDEFDARIAPLGFKVDRDAVREVWDHFVVPTQHDSAPPQSVEIRALMGILRGVYSILPPTDKEPYL